MNNTLKLDVDSAHRRFISECVERWQSSNGSSSSGQLVTSHSQLAIDIFSSLELLCGDEIAVVAKFVASHAWKASNPLLAIYGFVARIIRGQRTYGYLDLSTDLREWFDEIMEERADALVYQTIAQVVGVQVPVFDDYVAIVEFGKRADLAQEAQLLKTEREYRTHSRLCNGSEMRFGPDAIISRRCHQCGEVFSFCYGASSDALIPMHLVKTT